MRRQAARKAPKMTAHTFDGLFMYMSVDCFLSPSICHALESQSNQVSTTPSFDLASLSVQNFSLAVLSVSMSSVFHFTYAPHSFTLSFLFCPLILYLCSTILAVLKL